MLYIGQNTQIDSQSYVEKRIGMKEIEVTLWRRGRAKRGESNQASNQIPKCFPQPGTPKEIHRIREKREEGGDMEVKREGQKGKQQSSQ